MGSKTSPIALILLGVLALLPPRSVDAGQFKISPVRLELSAESPIGVLTVSNSGVEPLLLHLKVQAWDHASGQDRFLDTRELLLNPMIFELAPGGQQLVRIGLTRPSDSDVEQAYRLFIREVPQVARQKKRQITTVLHINLPVFVAPQEARAPELVWRLERSGAGGLALMVENRGNLHAEVFSVALQGHSSKPPVAMDRKIYVLPGQSRRLDVPDHLAQWNGPVTLTAESQNGPLQTALRLGESTTVEGALR